jgi:general stress protein 26
MKTQDLASFRDYVSSFGHAMLVTRREGGLRSRPMVILGVGDAAELYFFTNLSSGKLDELEADERVNLALQEGGRFCSISGSARILRDPRCIEAFWSDSQRAWFPDGPEDPLLVLLEVTPEFVEYWDRTGLEALRYAVASARAIVAGERLDDDQGEHVKMRIQ